jgi:exosortase A
MKLDTASTLRAMHDAPESRETPRTWMFATALVLSVVIWLLGWYGETVQSMVATWLHSSTFAHGFLIFPISAYLVWTQRAEIARLKPAPSLSALPLLAAAGFAWLLGRASDSLVIEQYSLVLMIPFIVAVILGSQVAGAIAFPLFFLLLAVPTGDFLLPYLMIYTADFTVSALQATGIPVYREGLHLAIPSGNWSVVEECGGLRYLISSLTLGCLYSYLVYRSATRRLLFVALSIVVPILANGLRAYLLVMIGHIGGMGLAMGIVHSIHGWVLFGCVMLLLFWIGSFWREERVVPKHRVLPAEKRPNSHTSLHGVLGASLTVAAMVALWPAYAVFLDALSADVPALKIPAAAEGWEPTGGRLTELSPHYLHARAEVSQTYLKDGKKVALYIAYYNHQRQSAELINSQNALVSRKNKHWANIGEETQEVRFGEAEFAARRTLLRGQNQHLIAWHWYWTDGHYTINPYLVKFLKAKSKLFGDGDDAALVAVYTAYEYRTETAEAVLQEFLYDMLPQITKNLNNANQS